MQSDTASAVVMQGRSPPSQLGREENTMIKLIKKLFKRGEKVTVCKCGKVYKFRSFEQAVAFMFGRRAQK